jgi:hypothetical protein
MKIILSQYNPGRAQIQLNDGQVFEVEMKNVRRHVLYDTVFIPGDTAVAAGSEWRFFQDIAGKRRIDTNITTPRRLANGERMVVTRVGFYIPKSFDDNITDGKLGVDVATAAAVAGGVVNAPLSIPDAQWLYENLYLELKLNGIRAVEGPAITFPAGYGVGGYESVSGSSNTELLAAADQFNTVVGGVSNILNGINSNSLIKDFAVESYIDHNTDIDGIVEVHNRAVWSGIAGAGITVGDAGAPTTTGTSMKMLLEGIIWSNN